MRGFQYYLSNTCGSTGKEPQRSQFNLELIKCKFTEVSFKALIMCQYLFSFHFSDCAIEKQRNSLRAFQTIKTLAENDGNFRCGKSRSRPFNLPFQHNTRPSLDIFGETDPTLIIFQSTSPFLGLAWAQTNTHHRWERESLHSNHLRVLQTPKKSIVPANTISIVLRNPKYYTTIKTGA